MGKIIITGSSGTIGTELFLQLLKKGFDVVGVDKNPNRWFEELNKKTIVANLLSKEEMKKLPIEDIDMIVHLAANARVYNSVIDPNIAKENINTVFNILEFARKHDISRLLFASSRETYGESSEPKKEDEVRIEKCESPYTASKIAGEALVHAYAKCYGLDFVIVRYSNVYGKYDTSDRLIPKFLINASKGKELKVYGENKTLDFTYIDDAVNGTIKSIEKFDEVKGNVFNIASGKGVKIIELAKKIKDLLNSQSQIIVEPNREGEIEFFVANIDKAKKLLGYEPRYSIDEGLKKAYEWYKYQGFL